MTLLFILQLVFATFITGLDHKPDETAKDKTDNNTVHVSRCEDFEISGEGSAKAWSNTEWIHITQRTDQADTYTTRAKVLYSETGLYFLFDCQDKILTASIQEDNLDLWEEDVVEVFLWTGEDFPVYFEYEISPLNFELPIMVPNYEGSFFGWLPWHYEGDRKTRHLTSTKGGPMESEAKIQSWMAEFFIPYKLLTPLPQVPPQPGTKWRANMYRIDHDQGTTLFSWQATSRTFHEYKKFGTFIFD